MTVNIQAPQFPESVKDGTIVSWHIKEGGKVKKDQVVAEIETDKVILEVVSPDDGVISQILKPEGSIVLSLESIAQLIVQSNNATPLVNQHNHQSKEPFMSSNYIVISIQDRNGYRTQKIHFNELPMTIGRDRDCDICADGTYASAQHGKLYLESNHLSYEDFSKNGTYINRTYINGRTSQNSLPVSVSINQNDKIILAGNQEGKYEDFPCIIIQEIQQGSDELFKLQSQFQNRLFNIFNQLQYDNKNPKLQGDVDDYISRCMPTLQIAKEVIGWTDEKLMKNAYDARILIYDMPKRSRRPTPTPTHQEYVQPIFEPIKNNLKIIQDDKENPIKISDDGNIFDLEELGGGGTSTVYRYNNQNSYKAIKIYTTQSTRVEYKEKLQVMLKTTPKSAKTVVNGQEYTQFVWPEALVFDDNGEVVGYLMPALPKHETYQLTTYVSGRENIEAKLEPNHHSIAYRIQVARNLAIAVQNLHEAGHYFIDIKPDNIFVFKDKCTVCLIDCDGFSIQQGKYPAIHYSEGYRAPFVLQNDLKAIDLSSEPYQDYYCLSHIIFQILDFGNSPFNGGVNTTELEDLLMEVGGSTYEYKVKNIWYPYQLDMKRDDIRPHKDSTFHSWPVGIRKLFDQAFLGDKWSVPKPIDWIDELNVYIQTQQFEKCQKEPNKTIHHHFKGMPCPIC